MRKDRKRLIKTIGQKLERIKDREILQGKWRVVVMFPEGQDSASKHQRASEIMTPKDRLLAQPNHS